MAKDTAKKNWKRNETRMQVFLYITILVNAVYAVLVLWRRGGYIRLKDILAFGFWLGQEYYCWRALKLFSAPTFNAEGTLASCPDASNPRELGVYTFAQDALWVCWVVQSLCCLHPAFFVFYLPLPATLIYKGYALARPLLPSWLAGGSGGVPDGGEAAAGNTTQTREERRREAIQRRKGRLVSHE